MHALRAASCAAAVAIASVACAAVTASSAARQLDMLPSYTARACGMGDMCLLSVDSVEFVLATARADAWMRSKLHAS